MFRLSGLTLAVAFLLLAPVVVSAGDDAADPAVVRANQQHFQTHVLPILQQHCYACHSHAAGEAKGGLVLDSRSGWQTGGDSGEAVVAGEPDESLLISAVRYEGLDMPPDGRLSDDEIRHLEQWVQNGAWDDRVTQHARQRTTIDIEAGREHWAFQPLQNAQPPVVADSAGAITDIDCFLQARRDQARLPIVDAADPYTWLRRVTLDLTGLPPTVEQIEQFVADPSPAAREQVVNRLLDSPAFGERWARHWLDLVGYADEVCTSNKVFAQHAWRYRDYVIEAYNGDKPFDEFVREQIAGDLLTRPTAQEQAESRTATGFLVLGHMEIVEADKPQMLVDIVDQQVTKVGRAFLGMTLECARCHDHKFDPIRQQDYYALAGFFHSTSSVYKTQRGVWSSLHSLELPETEVQRAERHQQQGEYETRVKELKGRQEQARQRQQEIATELRNQELAEQDRQQLMKEQKNQGKQIRQLAKQIQHAEFFAPAVPQAHGVKEADEPSDMAITIRGNPRALGAVVPRGFPQVMTEGSSAAMVQSGSGRLQLADWIATHPLTARVTVNRIWQKLFGEGLVRSVDYFGVSGDRPTHPLLLDYLAHEFMQNDWSQKQLIRRLVLSQAYALSGSHHDVAHSIDPDNQLLWRMNRVRLDAEAIRDSLIFLSGRLTSTGGPALPLEFARNVGGLDPDNVNPPGFRLDKWRPGQDVERTLYLPVIRYAAQPGPAAIRNVFDFPSPSEFRGKRAVTAVPTQALYLLNSPTVKQHATAVADHLTKTTPIEDRLPTLWLTVFNRPIRPDEQTEAAAFLETGGPAAWPELCHALIASNEFLMRL